MVDIFPSHGKITAQKSLARFKMIVILFGAFSGRRARQRDDGSPKFLVPSARLILSEKQPTTLRSGWKYTAAGADMVVSTLLGALIGYGLDKWLNTGPWMLVIWFILGSAAGFYSVYRRMQEGMKPPPSGQPK